MLPSVVPKSYGSTQPTTKSFSRTKDDESYQQIDCDQNLDGAHFYDKETQKYWTSSAGLFLTASAIVITCITLIVKWGSVRLLPNELSLILKRSHFRSSAFDWSATSSSIQSITTVNWSGLAENPWKLYKRTVNGNKGTNADSMDDFVSVYLGYTYLDTLGCDTNRIVTSSLQNDYTAGEFHYVDSDVFTDSTSKSVEQWNNMITALGFDTYNVFMNNYLQFYVNDLTPLLTKISNNGFTSYYTRLSSTPSVASSTGTLNVAHVILYSEAAGTYFDVVGPSDALSYSDLTEFGFQEWTEDECAGAHQLKWELEDYAYLSSLSTTTDAAWEIDSGLATPLFIGTGVPVTSLSKVDNIFTLAGTITNMTETTVVYNSCSYRELVIDAADDDDTTVTSTIVRYILQDSTIQGVTDYTLSDWEDVHDEVYAEQLAKEEAGEAQWSRYMDAHIGLESPTTESCDTSLEIIAKAYEAIDTTYAVSKRSYLHFYTGVPGVVSWEYNARECTTIASDEICGCLDNNSDNTFLMVYGYDCSLMQSKKGSKKVSTPK